VDRAAACDRPQCRARLANRAARFAGQAGRAAIANARRVTASVNRRRHRALPKANGLANSYTVADRRRDGDRRGRRRDDPDRRPRSASIANSLLADVSLVGLADVTGLAYSTTYYPYYDDPTFADPAPVVLVTTVALERAERRGAGAPRARPGDDPGGGGAAGHRQRRSAPARRRRDPVGAATKSPCDKISQKRQSRASRDG
jgi:hypothetical protein